MTTITNTLKCPALTARIAFIWLLLAFISTSAMRAADWPTYRGDQRRSGVASHTMDATKLVKKWVWKSSQPPASAWPDAAKWDAYAKLDGLRSMRDYDPVFHPTVSQGKVYLPSNVDDTVRCLRLDDGQELWRFTADSPVRIAPTCFAGRLYFAADDGAVYCLDAETGTLAWQRTIAPDSQTFVNDGRLCSSMPIRTGVLIDEEASVAIVSAGLFPWESTLMVALDLETGEIQWQRDLGTGWTLEGAMLLSPQHIIAPQGRSAPQLFERATGKPAGALPGGGGSFVLLTEDEKLYHGPGNKAGWLTESNITAPRDKDGKIEQVASFDRGTAIVVHEQTAYLLDEERLAAFDRSSGSFRWISPCPQAHDLIMVGDTLFTAGSGQVWAFASKNGKPLWKTSLEGQAMGLAASDNHLLVATDMGELVVFAEGGDSLPTPELPKVISAMPQPAQGPPPPQSVIDPTGLLQRWVFQRTTADDENSEPLGSVPGLAADGLPAHFPRGSYLVQAGSAHALLLEGRSGITIAADYRQTAVPAQELTVEAVVRVDKFIDWGGLISVTQDNGSYEKGWILGYRKDKFGFAINAEAGPDRLVWITDTQGNIKPQQWYHVVGTYDGERSLLYVNGQLVASSSEPKGAIRYPEQAGFHLAAYKDDDENFPLTGMLGEIGLYKRVMSAAEVSQRSEAILKNLPEPVAGATAEEPEPAEPLIPPSRGPVLKFIAPGVAEVSWQTDTPQATGLELVEGNGKIELLAPANNGRSHRALISNLAPRSVATYQITHQADNRPVRSPVYECDTHFDYTRRLLPPVASEDAAALAESASRAKAILGLADHKEPRGLALLWGCDDRGQLAEALCRSGNLDVCVLADQAEVVKAARDRLLNSGVYGRAVSVRHVPELADLHWPQRVFDLLVVPAALQSEQDLLKLCGMVQPNGRIVLDLERSCTALEDLGYVQFATDEVLGLQVLRAPRIAGAAGWTHMYGTPENTAFAGETLSGVRGIDDVRVAWAGRPGPRYQSDRGNRKPSPLAAGGRLYLQGLYRTIAVDAYNGTILWSLELPEVVRFNVPRDCSNWCVDEANVYISSEERCLVIDGASGEIKAEFEVPTAESQPAQTDDANEPELQWGYVARQSNTLIGTAVRANNAFTGYWGGEFWYDSKDGEHAKKVCSDKIFSLNPQSGADQWTYGRGLIINPTITISNNTIYFVECRDQALINGETRRLDGDAFWNNLHLVSLDLRSGKINWETPAKPLPGESAFYLLYASGKLIMQSSQGGKFALYAIDAETGKGLWRGMYAWQADHHGKHLSRPAVVGDTIYLRPLTLSLNDGAVISKTFPEGHQCGTYTCSSEALFLRAGSLAVWDRETAEATRWDRLRPDCWISTIPAEGMLLSPEGGGGCSCGGWIETSIGFAPKWDAL